jgi:hypothetical protein
MAEVLILGNGISRLAFKDRINAYQGEIWACNYAFREFPQVARLIGHVEPMEEAARLRDEGKLREDLIIYSAPFGGRRFSSLSVGRRWHQNSGISLIAEALHQGHRIQAAGFDLGGPDIHTPDHHLKSSWFWVERWAEVFREWGLDRVEFWGHDHRDFIIAVAEGRASARLYEFSHLRGRPHISEDEYLRVWEDFMGSGKAKPDQFVKVRYTANGFQSMMRLSVAEILRDRGSVQILTVLEKVEPDPGQETEGAEGINEEAQGEEDDDIIENADDASPGAGVPGIGGVRRKAGAEKEEVGKKAGRGADKK